MQRLPIFAGLGDILLSLITLIHSENLGRFKLQIPNELVSIYRNQSESYKKLVENLLDRLKVDWEWADISWTQAIPTRTLFDRYKVTDISQDRHKLITLFGLDSISDLPTNYVVIHTKSRDYNNNREIDDFCRNFKTSLPIVVIGERIISQNKENQICGAQSLYSTIMSNLDPTQTIIDCTYPDIQETCNFQTLCRDLAIISHAKCNIVFGQGGNLVMSAIFAKSFVCCVGGIQHPLFSSCPHGSFCIEATSMLDQIQL